MVLNYQKVLYIRLDLHFTTCTHTKFQKESAIWRVNVEMLRPKPFSIALTRETNHVIYYYKYNRKLWSAGWTQKYIDRQRRDWRVDILNTVQAIIQNALIHYKVNLRQALSRVQNFPTNLANHHYSLQTPFLKYDAIKWSESIHFQQRYCAMDQSPIKYLKIQDLKVLNQKIILKRLYWKVSLF